MGNATGKREFDDARRRAVVAMIEREGEALRRTARRYSLCAADAEDAYQRALEIVLLKAPNDRPRDLIRWTQVVLRHEALAVRRQRERLLGSNPAGGGEDGTLDWLDLVPASGAGPAERAERREEIGRSREALKTLKPAELRALTLLAEGYSYEEIGRITGFSRTKINRCLAEGRERYRKVLAGGEDGTRCARMRPLLSAHCDGEAGIEDEAVREHLRACANCRATLRAYRAAAGAAKALAPVPVAASLWDRARDAIGDLVGRLGGGGSTGAEAGTVAAGGATAGGAATGVAGGLGAKVAVATAIVAGGGAAGIAASGATPPGLPIDRATEAGAVRLTPPIGGGGQSQARSVDSERRRPSRRRSAAREANPRPPEPASATAAAAVAPAPEPIVESAPAPEPPPVEPVPEAPPPPAPSAGSPAGEFGP